MSKPIKRDKSLDKQYVRLLKESARLKVGEPALIKKELSKYNKYKKKRKCR